VRRESGEGLDNGTSMYVWLGFTYFRMQLGSPEPCANPDSLCKASSRRLDRHLQGLGWDSFDRVSSPQLVLLTGVSTRVGQETT
jgi:hypothetical protein